MLPYDYLANCVEAYRQGLHLDNGKPVLGVCDVGLDIADAGTNRNAMTVRRGPIIESVEEWATLKAGFLKPTAMRANSRAGGSASLTHLLRWRRCGCADEGGVCADRGPSLFGARDQLWSAGGRARQMYRRNQTNKDEFHRRNAQMGFALRYARLGRPPATWRGKGVLKSQCLFINPDIPQRERFLAMLTQPPGSMGQSRQDHHR